MFWSTVEAMGDLSGIIKQLEDQRAAIDKALAALREISGVVPATTTTKRRGRPKKTVRRGGMSEEGRRRIAEAQKARWAAKKKAEAQGRAKGAPKKAGS